MPRTADRRTVTAGALGALAVVVWAIIYRTYGGTYFTYALLVPTVTLVVITLTLAAPGRTNLHRPVASGRVVAIIPAFNEEADALAATVRSLLSGTVPPNEIHVVDDGSDIPVEPFDHPKVRWHRTSNGGKRHAQAVALRKIVGADYILTVDSDSTVDRLAVQRLLQALSDDQVQAATGLPLARNRGRLLPRIIDLEIASICLTYRAARSMLGSLTTCSGALSLYRAPVVLDNLDQYVAEGIASGDDRRLTHYALLRGKVVSVPEAKVQTDMPTTLRGLYRQRIRWSASHWRYKPWEMAHLPTGAMLWAGYHTTLSIIVPLALVWTFAIYPIAGDGFAWTLLAYWAVANWLVTLKYVAGRPDMSLTERLLTWLLGMPVLMLVQLVIIRPAMIHALFKARSSSWGTRGAKRGRHRGQRVPLLSDLQEIPQPRS